MQVTIKGHTQSICFESQGSHNVFERLLMQDGQAIGLYHVRGSDNLFLNCDAWNNRDTTSEDGKGGNVDGFGCHPPEGGKCTLTGNSFTLGLKLTDQDFVSLDEAELLRFRQADGELPAIDFLRPVTGGALNGAGVGFGLLFPLAKPDIGALGAGPRR